MSNTKAINEKLNILLSDVMVYYQNLRGYHWNVKGQNFFELHMKFEELYTQAAEFADDVAERILKLGGQPLDTYTKFLEKSQIKPTSGISKDTECVRNIVDQNAIILDLINDIVKTAGEAEDEGTVDLMTTQIEIIEERLWMYKSWLGK